LKIIWYWFRLPHICRRSSSRHFLRHGVLLPLLLTQ